jgi:hypothetical protein
VMPSLSRDQGAAAQGRAPGCPGGRQVRQRQPGQ